MIHEACVEAKPDPSLLASSEPTQIRATPRLAFRAVIGASGKAWVDVALWRRGGSEQAGRGRPSLLYLL